jgi:hypothetical protein
MCPPEYDDPPGYKDSSEAENENMQPGKWKRAGRGFSHNREVIDRSKSEKKQRTVLVID